MSSEASTRATGKIEVHTYEPVIPGSGTGDLTGLRGEGGFTANLGESADITLDYWFE